MSKILSNLHFIISRWVKWDIYGTLWMFARIPFSVLGPIIAAYIPKVITDIVIGDSHLDQLLLMLVIMCTISALISFSNAFLEEKASLFEYNVSMHYAKEMTDKLLSMNYSYLESYEGRYMFERCRKFAFDGSLVDGAWACVRLVGLLTSLLGILSYVVVLSFVTPYMIVIIFLTCFAEFYLSISINRIASKTEDEMTAGEMKFFYFYRLAQDGNAKADIHLNKAYEWLAQNLRNVSSAYADAMRRFTRKTTQITGIQVVFCFIRDAAIFIFLIAKTIAGEIPIGNFVFYIGLMTGFASWINGISGHISSLIRIAGECQKYRDFIELPQNSVSGQDNLPSALDVHSIVFEHVSFSYDGKSDVLKDISFSVRTPQKIAIVGRNGSGKTTLIMLLCGLFEPTKGRILINGMDTHLMDKRTQFACFSTVFQEFNIYPTTVMRNIVMDSKKDEEYAYQLVERVGLQNRISREDLNRTMKNGNESVNLSGGEEQLLLLSRALCKDGSVYIMDEPTSALDPITEEKIYAKQCMMTKNKLTFLISHRLTSTQFCDQIFFMDDGQIVECGTHKDLVMSGGEYQKMYEVQKYYYQCDTE